MSPKGTCIPQRHEACRLSAACPFAGRSTSESGGQDVHKDIFSLQGDQSAGMARVRDRQAGQCRRTDRASASRASPCCSRRWAGTTRGSWNAARVRVDATRPPEKGPHTGKDDAFSTSTQSSAGEPATRESAQALLENLLLQPEAATTWPGGAGQDQQESGPRPADPQGLHEAGIVAPSSNWSAAAPARTR